MQDRFAWHRMTVVDTAGRFPADDGPRELYADSGGRVSIEINRRSGTPAPATGDHVLHDCLVDRIPPRLEPPGPDVPRLPPMILESGEALRPTPRPR